ncbi:MAG: hypothetical protein ABR955_14740 [Verrucomicrobiota bacterium]
MKSRRFIHAIAMAGILFFNGIAFGDALDNWVWRNPLPNGNPQPLPPTLNGIVFTNGEFFAVGSSGVVSISSNATNWMQIATATTNTLNDIAYGNGLFLAVGDGGAVETSTNGTSWALETSGTTNTLNVAAYGNGKWVAAGGSVVITSPDGTNWSPAASGISGAKGLAGNSAGFVAVSGNIRFSLRQTARPGQVRHLPLQAKRLVEQHCKTAL